jgi:RHS repeat-associated protein
LGVPSPDYFGGGSVNKVYIGGIEYANNTNNAVAPSRIQTEEGFVGLRENWTESSLLTKYVYYYTLKDHLGNIRIVMNDDQDAELVQSNSYSAFGLLALGPNAGALKYNSRFYNGKEKQEDTGWLDYGARMYIPESGRWLTLDPSHEDGGQESTSPYGYVFDDPIKHIDPDGKLPHIIAGAIAGGLIGGAIELGSQLYKGESVNLRAIAGATVRGAIVGGTAAATGGLSLGVVALGGAAGNVVGGALDNKIQGKEVTGESITKDAISGGLSAAGGSLAGKFINSNVTAKITTPQTGFVTNHTLEGGKVVFSKGLSNSTTTDFVISKAGKVTMGSGHWFMSGGSKVVRGVGTLSLKNGQIDAISNWSGHYKPTAAQLNATAESLKKAGYSFTDNFQKLITK